MTLEKYVILRNWHSDWRKGRHALLGIFANSNGRLTWFENFHPLWNFTGRTLFTAHGQDILVRNSLCAKVSDRIMSIASVERRGEISHTYARVRTYLTRAYHLNTSHCGGNTKVDVANLCSRYSAVFSQVWTKYATLSRAIRARRNCECCRKLARIWNAVVNR